jgi:Cd2+/Zn2+-exporting ATPase
MSECQSKFCCEIKPLAAPLANELAIEDAPQEVTIHIAQMCCPTEERLLRHALAKLPGVVALDYNLMQRR